jgi:hypothetical protein
MESKKIDLAALDTAAGGEQGFELQLTNPGTDVALDITINVLGADSDPVVEVERELARKRGKAIEKARRLRVGSPEELEADAIELLVAATIGWKNVELDGTPLTFTKDNARLLYRRFRWIREQVDQAIQDRRNFLPKRATS